MRRVLPNSLLVLAALAVAAAGGNARSPREDAARQQMEQAERARAAEQAAQQEAAARAAAAAIEAQRLTADRIAAAARLRQAETATSDAASRIDQLADERRRASANLDARAETMQPLLPLIERLSLFPAETLLAVPARPEETLRGRSGIARSRAAARRGGRGVARRTGAARHGNTRDEGRGARLAAAQGRNRPRPLSSIGCSPRPRPDGGRPKARPARRQGAPRTRPSQAENLRGMFVELEVQRRAERRAPSRQAPARERQKRPGEAIAAAPT